MKTKKLCFALFAIVGLIPLQTMAASSQYDARFLSYAAGQSLKEINHGWLARTNALTWEVREFGLRLVNDHGASYNAAAALAANLGSGVPADLTQGEQRQWVSLSRLSTNRFDRVLVDLQIRDHLRTIRAFEGAALRAQNAEVRAYARQQLPVLMVHLVQAMELRDFLRQNP